MVLQKSGLLTCSDSLFLSQWPCRALVFIRYPPQLDGKMLLMMTPRKCVTEHGGYSWYLTGGFTSLSFIVLEGAIHVTRGRKKSSIPHSYGLESWSNDLPASYAHWCNNDRDAIEVMNYFLKLDFRSVPWEATHGWPWHGGQEPEAR